MTDAELAYTKELSLLMTERVFMNPVSAKLLSEDWRKAFPDEVAVAERIKALVEALEKAQTINAAPAILRQLAEEKQKRGEVAAATAFNYAASALQKELSK